MNRSSTEDNVNVAALRRVDPYVKRIVRSASQVALYKYDTEWVKTETEGALFLCERNGKPYYNIIIMNRLNVRNLIEPVTEAIDIQLNMPFLLYKNSKSKIFGIWFYDKDECSGIAGDIQRMINTLRQQSMILPVDASQRLFLPTTDSTAVHSNPKTNDIFTLLNKAQQNVSNSTQTTASTAGCTSESVLDFFKKACNSSTNSKSIPQTTSILMKPKAELPHSIPNKNVSPVVLSNLIQQMIITKNDNRETRSQQQSVYSASTQTRSNSKLPTIGGNPESFNLHTAISVENQAPAKTAADNGVQSLRSSTENQQFLMTPTMFLKNDEKEFIVGNYGNNDNNNMDNENVDNDDRDNNIKYDHQTRRQSYLQNFKVIDTNEDRAPSVSLTSITIEPLTLKQFQQAFIDLLQNDRDFLKKLHESYYKSITNLIS